MVTKIYDTMWYYAASMSFKKKKEKHLFTLWKSIIDILKWGVLGSLQSKSQQPVAF